MPRQRTSLPFAYLAVLAAAVLCYAALGSVLAILPHYVPERLRGGPAALGFAVGAPALTALLARPLGGRLADRFGPLSPLLGGAGVMAAGAVPAAASTSLGALLVSRLITGAGEGVMMSATVLWLLRLAGPDRRGRALGHIGLANYGGLALGPLLDTALGGPSASLTVLWIAGLLPLAGAVTALGAHWAAGTVRQPLGSSADQRTPVRESQGMSTRALLRRTAPAGLGLLLVNIGYVSVLSFGAAVARQNATGLETAIVPTFAAVVIVTRTLGGGIPDRLGGRRTVSLFAGAEALGLLVYANTRGLPLALAALVTLSIGQSLAVPALGLLALAGVPQASQGAAAGMFFAWFDAGVGLGGPVVGAAASLTDPRGALAVAAAAVAGAVLVARFHRRTGADSATQANGDRLAQRQGA
jgi:predicted MFS family arabinose efflux permease